MARHEDYVFVDRGMFIGQNRKERGIPLRRKIYIAGPMSNYPHMNFPLFYTVARELGLLGCIQDDVFYPEWDVVNPADLDTEEMQLRSWKNWSGDPDNVATVGGWKWASIIGRDVEAVINCDAICLLPGWHQSTGAKIEAAVAYHTGKEIYEWGVDGVDVTGMDIVDPDSDYFKMKVLM